MSALGPGPVGSLPPAPGPAYAPPGWAPPQRSWRQWVAYARAHLDAGRPIEQLYAEMAMVGMSPMDGQRLLREVAGGMRKRALLLLGSGVVMVVVGLALVWVNLQSSRQSGTGYWWFGLVASGLISGGRGIYELRRIPRA